MAYDASSYSILWLTGSPPRVSPSIDSRIVYPYPAVLDGESHCSGWKLGCDLQMEIERPIGDTFMFFELSNIHAPKVAPFFTLMKQVLLSPCLVFGPAGTCLAPLFPLISWYLICTMNGVFPGISDLLSSLPQLRDSKT